MPRRDVIRASLEGRGALIHTRSMEEACAISNRIAPEHLEVERATRTAGSRCCGTPARSSSAPTPARAWATTAPGPNHVLPTSGTARFSSPLGVYDFQKRSSLIEVSEAGAQALGPIAAELAYGEGLQAHARAAEMRLEAGGDADERLACPSASQRVIRQDVQSMHAYAIQPSAGLVKLDAMENPFRLPRGAAARTGRAAGRAWRSTATRPQRVDDAARRAGARTSQLPAGCELMLGNGSDELITLLALACDVPGATVLAPLPGFVMYEMSAQLQGLRFVGVPLTADFELDEAAMLAAIEQHRPASPTSPTRTTRPPTCATTRVIDAHRRGGRRAGRAGGVRRGLPAVRLAQLDAAPGARTRMCW